MVGNSGYQNAPRLATPLNDAEDIAAALGGLGFDVILRRDTTRDELQQALRDFAAKSAKADIAIVYFAGYSANSGLDGLPHSGRRPAGNAHPSFQTEAIPLRAATLHAAGARRARARYPRRAARKPVPRQT